MPGREAMAVKAWSGNGDEPMVPAGAQKASFRGNPNVRKVWVGCAHSKGVFKRSCASAHFAHIETYVRMCGSSGEDFSSLPHMCGNVRMCESWQRGGGAPCKHLVSSRNPKIGVRQPA